MSLFASLLRGERIADVYVDSEVCYLLLENGTQVTIHGQVAVQPEPMRSAPSAETVAS